MNSGILKHFLNIGFGSIINVLLGFITTPLITRIVDPSEFGRLNIFDTYSGIILSFIHFGLDQSLIRFFYEYDSVEEKSGLLKYCLGVPTAVSIVLFIVMYFLIKNNVFSFGYSDLIFIFLFSNVLSSIWQKISNNMLRLTYESKAYSASVIIQKIVYCIVVVGGAIFIRDYYLEIIIIATIASFVAATLVAIIATKEYWKFNKAKIPTNYKEVTRYGFPLIFFALIVTLLDSLDKLNIKKFCSEYEVGVYASSFTLISLFALLQTTFNSIWLPAQTEHLTSNPEDTTFIRKGNKYITLIMFFAAINTIMFKDLICYILGSSYRSCSVFLPFLIIDCIMFTISDSTCSGIDKSKKSYLNILVSGIPCLFSYLIQIALIPLIGAKGACIARAIASITYFYLRTYFSNKYYYIDYDLDKFTVVLLALITFAYINTFYSTNGITIMVYIICMAILILLYREDIIDMYNYFKSSLIPDNQE